MRVYRFAAGSADGSAKEKDLLGGKGANLAEMCRLGVPVPPGFTLPTTLCREMLREGRLSLDLPALIDEGLAHIERATGKRFGDPENPLLVSVRSGAPVSMPGMMETVLDIGLNDEIAERWAKRTKDAPVVWDAYRRFLQMYADVVLGIGGDEDESPFERLLANKREERGVRSDAELSAADLRELTRSFQSLIASRIGRPLSHDPREHLYAAVTAVFESWNTKRAIAYRELHGLPHDMGTACNVQAMVFGDLDDDSGTAVVFTRDPSTGERVLFGELLVRAQGEDVVAGIRTPDALHRKQRGAVPGRTLEERMPAVYGELTEILEKLERHFADVQDVELTIEGGRLWILQTRAAKRSARAAVRVAVDFVNEGLIDDREALLRVKPEAVTELLLPALDEHVRESALAGGALLARGLPASPGVGRGVLVLGVEEAVVRAEGGEAVILVRPETSADDIRGMHAAAAIVTARGGMTSHAAVVARGMGRPCVAGVSSLVIDAGAGKVRFGSREVCEGELITVDGTHGEVFAGALETTRPGMPKELERLLEWADEHRRLGVRANADTPEDALRARELGAFGIGLCRTEHMFFAAERVVVMRELILAESEDARRAALRRLGAMQREDFAAIFRAMSGLPVTIRLLDPPLHEFLPSSDEEVRAVARDLGIDEEAVRAASERHREANPMLGHRGCRLSVTFPEITEMQTRAALEGAREAEREGAEVLLEIMVPLVAEREELVRVKEAIERARMAFEREMDESAPLMVGTMIELPRACLLAGEIAREAAFFSFGTNDLTQTTFGLSRDDGGRFLPDYVSSGVLAKDPFETLDERGVGELVRVGVERGRAARPELEVGLCGEHGGDPASIDFCERVGLDYVSCSPWRVPIARLAAAQARLRRDPGAPRGGAS